MKKICGVILFLLTFTQGIAFNIGIAPTSFEISLDKPETKEVTILNNTAEEMRVEVSPEKPENYNEEHYLGKWMRIYPKVVSVKPFGKQIVRFALRTPSDLPHGEYKSYLVFKEIPKKPVDEINKKENMKININMLTEIAISIYGEKGNQNIIAEVKKINLKKDGNKIQLETEIVPKGNSSVKAFYEVKFYNVNGKLISNEEGIIGRTGRSKAEKFETLINLPQKKADRVNIKILDQKRKVILEKEMKIITE